MEATQRKWELVTEWRVPQVGERYICERMSPLTMESIDTRREYDHFGEADERHVIVTVREVAE